MKRKLVHTGLLAIALAISLMAAPSSAHATGGHWMSDNYYYDFIGGQWYQTAYWEPIGHGNGYLWQAVNGWERTMLYWNGQWSWVSPPNMRQASGTVASQAMAMCAVSYID